MKIKLRQAVTPLGLTLAVSTQAQTFYVGTCKPGKGPRKGERSSSLCDMMRADSRPAQSRPNTLSTT